MGLYNVEVCWANCAATCGCADDNICAAAGMLTAIPDSPAIPGRSSCSFRRGENGNSLSWSHFWIPSCQSLSL